MKSFIGVLARVDSWSDGSPSGARGRRIIIPRDVAMRGLYSLIEKPLWTVHTGLPNIQTRMAGIILWADVIGDEVWIAGEWWDTPFTGQLSFEAKDCTYEETGRNRYKITSLTFTGAAWVHRGAYIDTWIETLEDTDEFRPTATDLTLLQRGYFRQRVSPPSQASL